MTAAATLLPFTEAEAEFYAEHASQIQLYEMCARRELTPRDAARVLVMQRRMGLPRWVRRTIEQPEARGLW
jgi:hypothetical protein